MFKMIYGFKKVINNIHISKPKIANFSGKFTEFGYQLDWTNIKGSYPIDYIEIRQ